MSTPSRSPTACTGTVAAATVVTVPIMLIALFTQRFIVSGLAARATKG
ncbi:hypothetical protein [Brachybacterium sp. AOP29-B2-41]